MTLPLTSAQSWSFRLATATGGLAALALIPTAGKAALVTVTNNPISLGLSEGIGATANWDVDGDGNVDFQLKNSTSSAVKYILLNSNGLAGRGVVNSNSFGDNAKALADSFVVGPTLASNFWGGYNWGFRGILDTQNGNGGIGYDVPTFADGDNYLGFRFDKGGSLHYGYANVNLDLSMKSVTISEWAYKDVPGESLHVEAINPVPGPIGLAGLAGGAAWTRKLRKRIKTAN